MLFPTLPSALNGESVRKGNARVCVLKAEAVAEDLRYVNTNGKEGKAKIYEMKISEEADAMKCGSQSS